MRSTSSKYCSQKDPVKCSVKLEAIPCFATPLVANTYFASSFCVRDMSVVIQMAHVSFYFLSVSTLI